MDEKAELRQKFPRNGLVCELNPAKISWMEAVVSRARRGLRHQRGGFPPEVQFLSPPYFSLHYGIELIMPASKGSERALQREVSSRWTPALTKGGWTPVSDYFLESYTKLDPPITNSEALLIIHLMRHKWDTAPPFPGFKTLAKRMGISTTATRNHARSLEKKGYLVREKRVGTTNLFDLNPLFLALEKLQAYEEGKKDERKEARERKTGGWGSI